MKAIPNGWTKCLFNDLIEKILDNRGKTPPIEKTRTDYPLLEVNSISDNMSNPNYNKVTKYVSEKSYNEWFRAGHPIKGDILMPTVGTLGNAVVMAQNKGSIAQNIIAIRIVSEQDSLFWYYNITSPIFRNQIEKVQMNSAQPSLKVPHMRKFNVMVPPFSEQQKIAEILSTVDDKIEVIDQQIIETQALKKGLMQRLLTKGIGHTELKDSLLGMIPKSWEVVKLGDIAEIVDPQPDHRTPAEVVDGIPYIGMGDINNGKINFDNARKVSPEALNKQIRGFEIYPEAFVFGKIGTIGNPTPIPTDRFYALSANLILMTSKKLEIAKYLYVIIQSSIIDKQLKHMTNTTSQPALGIKKARELMVPLPKEKEMNQISDTMRLIEEKLIILMDKKESYQELKQGLMQQLLTGKIRVKV